MTDEQARERETIVDNLLRREIRPGGKIADVMLDLAPHCFVSFDGTLFVLALDIDAYHGRFLGHGDDDALQRNGQSALC